MVTEDERYIKRCIDLAQLGLGKVAPNPMVGCVIVKDGSIIGEGFHGTYGGPHAEIEAIKSVANYQDIVGATVYVSLEPCSHFGTTPPCTVSLIDAKPKRVVIGSSDTNPSVSGKGIDRLKAEGIEVITGILESECRD